MPPTMSPTTPTATPTPSHLLSASYDSPFNPPFSHAQAVPAFNSAQQPADRVAYLAALRRATTGLQEIINRELTLRMEDDKARDAAGAAAGAAAKGKRDVVDEGKEEENYGEEVAEDED